MKKEDERINKIFEDILRFKQKKSVSSVSVSETDLEPESLPPGLIRMIQELQAYISVKQKNEEQIKKKNAGLQQMVNDLNSQLQSVNKELEILSYSVSHDLRAPLRAVDGFTKILDEEYNAVLDAEAKRMLEIIQYNAKKMSELIDSLLIFSRTTKKEINRVSIDMNFLVEYAVIEINRNVPNKAQIKADSLIPVAGDYAMIQQVFINLISNAVKFSSGQETPLVEIKSELKKNEVVYTVKDNGVGFNMKYADRLFGVFQKLHAPEEFEGVGMGLAIAQRIINKHGGRIWADSQPGKGALFSFALPVVSIK